MVEVLGCNLVLLSLNLDFSQILQFLADVLALNRRTSFSDEPGYDVNHVF